ncbi:MAG: hypothetical protein AAFV53_31585 [Myxococcota bacterium]
MTRTLLFAITATLIGCESETDSGTDTAQTIAAEIVREGEAIVNGRYAGTETLRVITEEDEVLCQLALTLSDAGARTDCDLCDWAYDLNIDTVDVVTDVHCADAGFDPSALAGTTISYGYENYLGHGQTLFTVIDGAWDDVDFCAFDESTGAFSYIWDGTDITITVN